MPGATVPTTEPRCVAQHRSGGVATDHHHRGHLVPTLLASGREQEGHVAAQRASCRRCGEHVDVRAGELEAAHLLPRHVGRAAAHHQHRVVEQRRRWWHGRAVARGEDRTDRTGRTGDQHVVRRERRATSCISSVVQMSTAANGSSPVSQRSTASPSASNVASGRCPRTPATPSPPTNTSPWMQVRPMAGQAGISSTRCPVASWRRAQLVRPVPAQHRVDLVRVPAGGRHLRRRRAARAWVSGAATPMSTTPSPSGGRRTVTRTGPATRAISAATSRAPVRSSAPTSQSLMARTVLRPCSTRGPGSTLGFW